MAPLLFLQAAPLCRHTPLPSVWRRPCCGRSRGGRQGPRRTGQVVWCVAGGRGGGARGLAFGFVFEAVKGGWRILGRRVRDPGTFLLVVLGMAVGWVAARVGSGDWEPGRFFGKETGSGRERARASGSGGGWDESMEENERKSWEAFEGARGGTRVGERAFDVVSTDDGENSLWLNASLRATWTLFRKSTSSLVADVLQPMLDSIDLPPLVARMEIVSLRLGERPPLVRRIRRLPCRALSEIQYAFNARLVSDNSTTIDFLVHTKLPVFERVVKVPVTVNALDLDANTWCAAKLVPYPPYLSCAQWSLLELPVVKINLCVAKVLPISTIPVLSTVLTTILTKILPRQFLFPKFQAIDLRDAHDLPYRAPAAADDDDDASAAPDFAALRARNPELWRVFSSIDLDDDGELTPAELAAGLTSWGYSSLGDQAAVLDLLDRDDGGGGRRGGGRRVSFGEFAAAWPTLRDSLVPQRYVGVVGGVMLSAAGLPRPLLGLPNAYALLRLGRQAVATRRDRDSGRSGRPGEAVWMEAWEVLVESEQTEVLTVEVRDAAWFVVYPPAKDAAPGPHDPARLLAPGKEERAPPVPPAAAVAPVAGGRRPPEPEPRGTLLGRGSVAVASLVGKGLQRLSLELDEGQGRVRIDLAYARFVDPTMEIE